MFRVPEHRVNSAMCARTSFVPCCHPGSPAPTAIRTSKLVTADLLCPLSFSFSGILLNATSSGAIPDHPIRSSHLITHYFHLLHTTYCHCEHFIYVFSYFQSSPLDCLLHLSRDGCSWFYAQHLAQRMPYRDVFVKCLLIECELLLLHSDLICCMSSITAVGLDAPENVRQTSLVALEGGRGTSGPFLVQGGGCCPPTASLWTDAEESQPSVGRSQVLEMLLQLSVRAAPAAHYQTDKGMCPRLRSSAGTQQEAGTVAADRRLPSPQNRPRMHRTAWWVQKRRLGSVALRLCCRTGLDSRSWSLAPAPPVPAEMALPAQRRARPRVSHLPLALP